jgi:hypothetical protein
MEAGGDAPVTILMIVSSTSCAGGFNYGAFNNGRKVVIRNGAKMVLPTSS